MPIKVYCLRTEPVDGKVVCRNVDILNEVFCIGVTPKGSKQFKAGIPMFTTKDGTYLQFHNIEEYETMLKPYGFDLFHSSFLVNTSLIDRIEVSKHGNVAFFKDGGDFTAPVSRPKTEEYPHLVKRPLNPIPGF